MKTTYFFTNRFAQQFNTISTIYIKKKRMFYNILNELLAFWQSTPTTSPGLPYSSVLLYREQKPDLKKVEDI